MKLDRGFRLATTHNNAVRFRPQSKDESVQALYRDCLLYLATATDRDSLIRSSTFALKTESLVSNYPSAFSSLHKSGNDSSNAENASVAPIKHLVTIVSPRTFLRWLNDEKPKAKQRTSPGRPRTDEDVRALILRLARETGWGYTRILGEPPVGDAFFNIRSSWNFVADDHGWRSSLPQ